MENGRKNTKAEDKIMALLFDNCSNTSNGFNFNGYLNKSSKLCKITGNYLRLTFLYFTVHNPTPITIYISKGQIRNIMPAGHRQNGKKSELMTVNFTREVRLV